MANQPTAPAARPPPEVPYGVDNTLATYLRSFSLWCRSGFIDLVRSNEAMPGILMSAKDDRSKVFLIEVNAAGAITASAVPLGGVGHDHPSRSSQARQGA